jgi:hypothetical protein
LITFIPAIQAIPIVPVFFTGMVETVSIMGTKDISVAFGVDRTFIFFHGLTPCFNKVSGRFFLL